MKILYNILLFASALQISLAQENDQPQFSFPQFDECEKDDQADRSCFENNFEKKFKTFYRETEIATDYNYTREVVGSYEIDRRGEIIQKGYNTPESPIFVSIERAIDKFQRLQPVVNEKNRPVEFYFQVKFNLQRSQPYKDDALDIVVEFIYPELDKENS